MSLTATEEKHPTESDGKLSRQTVGETSSSGFDPQAQTDKNGTKGMSVIAIASTNILRLSDLRLRTHLVGSPVSPDYRLFAGLDVLGITYVLVRNQLKPRRNDTIDLLTLGHFCVPKIYPNVDFKGCFK